MSPADVELPASPEVAAPDLAPDAAAASPPEAAASPPEAADYDALVLSLKASLASSQTLLQSQSARLATLADTEASLAALRDQHAFVAAAKEAVEAKLQGEVRAREVAEEAAEQLRVQVDNLRGQVEQARRGVMQLQKAETDRRRMSAQIGLGAAGTGTALFPIGDEDGGAAGGAGAALGVPEPPSDRSKRASFMGGARHRRVSSQSEPDASPATPAAALSPPPLPAKGGLRELRLGSVSASPSVPADDAFAPAPAVPETPAAEQQAYDPTALEMAQDENTRLRGELLAVHARLAETEDARAASETCLRALREFMAGQAGGPGGDAAAEAAAASFSIPGLSLPPLPTDRDAEGSLSPRADKQQRWTGFKLWGGAGAAPGGAARPAPSPANSTAVEPPSTPHSPPARSVASASMSAATSDRNSVPPVSLNDVQDAAASVATPLASFVSSWTKGVSPGTPAVTPAAAASAGAATRKITSFFRRGVSQDKDLPSAPGLEPSPSITEREGDDEGEGDDGSAAHAEMQGIKLPPKPSDAYIPTPEMQASATVPGALLAGEDDEDAEDVQGAGADEDRRTSRPTPATTASALDDEVETPLTSPKLEDAAEGGKTTAQGAHEGSAVEA